MQKSHTSTYIYAIIFCILVLFIIIFPNETFLASLEGLKLWFNVVCPALLPFFICIEILIGLGVVSFLGGLFKGFMQPVFNVPGEASFAFFMSMSSGYPVGAKVTAKLRQDNSCTSIEGQRILSFCSTSGPLFIIGAVATGILGNPKLGFLLALAHYLSAITIGFFMRFYKMEKQARYLPVSSSPLKDMLEYRRRDGRSIGNLMGDAVRNGVNLILLIGGFIILFSVITSVLKVSGFLTAISKLLSMLIPFVQISHQTISCILVGFLEVTNGIKECAALHLPLISKVIMVSFMIGFGGLSVNAQVISIIADTDLKFGIYLMMKIIQGIIASIYSYFIFFLLTSTQVQNTFRIYELNTFTPFNNFTWLQTFMNSLSNMLLILAFLFILGLLCWKPLKPN